MSALLVLLTSALVFVPLFSRLGLSSVVGYLVAGLVVGPAAFHWIHDVEQLTQLSELGVVLLLFLIGLELHPRKLWQWRAGIFGAGSIQVTVITALLAGVLKFWLPWLESLVIGFSMALSSTAVGLHLLKERKLLGTEAGQLGFSVLLFQDLITIPFLVILPLLANRVGEVEVSPWRTLGYVFLSLSLLWVMSRFLLRPLFRLVALTRQRELLTALSLLLVLGVSFGMHALGLSMGLGAFFSGVLLAQSEYRQELEVNLEPFKGLLLGLFFMTVGMNLNLTLFLSQPAFLLGAALALVAFKIAVGWVLARLFRGSSQSSGKNQWIFALALSQVGEFAFVILGLSKSLKILNVELAAMVEVVVVLSLLSTPILFPILERWLQSAGKDLEKIKEGAHIRNLDHKKPVIIAGFGRMGQIIQRVLVGHGHECTIVDQDPNQIELVKKFGVKAYYGDASRSEVLEAAGVSEASLLVLAIDNSEASIAAIGYCSSHYPKLPILARSRNRNETYELMQLRTGVSLKVFRETFGSALEMAGSALQAMGCAESEVHQRLMKFRNLDEATLEKAALHYKNEEKLISISQSAREELKKILAEESTQSNPTTDPTVQ